MERDLAAQAAAAKRAARDPSYFEREKERGDTFFQAIQQAREAREKEVLVTEGSELELVPTADNDILAFRPL
jgi:hypothetical protein